MTIEQDVLRADLRASMTASMPDYSVDPKAVGRVGKVIGDTAGQEERKIRASDGRGRLQDQSPHEDLRAGPNIWLWISICTSSCVVLLGVLAYWRLG